MEILSGQVQIWTTFPTGPAKKIYKLSLELIFPLFPCEFLLCHSPSLPVLVRSINIAPFRAEARWPSAEPSATRCSTLANRWPAHVLAPTTQLTANDRLRRQQHHSNEHGPVWLCLSGEKKSHTHTHTHTEGETDHKTLLVDDKTNLVFWLNTYYTRKVYWEKQP